MSAQKRINWSKVWDVIAWIGLGIVFLYFLLKIVGVLHSPVAADVITLLGGGAYLGRYTQKINHIEKRLDKLEGILIAHIQDGRAHR